MYLLRILISCFAFTLTSQKNEKVNERPIVGVAVMEITDEDLVQIYPALVGKHYVPASYVKLIEMTGARVVPISPLMSNETVEYIFNSVNGLLFPGAGNNLSDTGYFYLTKKLFQLSMKANKAGVVFPLMGICRGFQALVVHVEGNQKPLIVTDSFDLATTVRWDVEELRKHSFLSAMPKKMIRDSEKDPITAHFHQFSVTPKSFKHSSKLNSFFRVLATSSDRKGTEFVSAVQAKKFPFYGIQFHPEKTMFEWATTINIPHSPQAIRLGQFVANSFMDNVRRNKRSFGNSSIERKYLMEQYELMRTDDLDSHAPFREIFII
ncbi:gamma-glutamyl hydrolase-like [Hydractinia symbiolongicarpus]|uniref:gamma-glutamyl hydrolase-like n=1 Tax=Hydractinia symbiolongicarpus TaxID=13093 RepID=UPI00254EF7B0|nr:gamma-glutamyl hydrolase-like [Hydractinia symbiolongicarpus]